MRLFAALVPCLVVTGVACRQREFNSDSRTANVVAGAPTSLVHCTAEGTTFDVREMAVPGRFQGVLSGGVGGNFICTKKDAETAFDCTEYRREGTTEGLRQILVDASQSKARLLQSQMFPLPPRELLTLACSTGEEAPAAVRIVPVPAADLLAAARKIKPQTGPAYKVEGSLACESISSEVPPYGTTLSCSITVEGQTKPVEHPETLAEAVLVGPGNGPVNRASVKFTATSVSSEVPPYRSTEQAHIERP